MGLFYESIICVSDLQFPFAHQDWAEFYAAIKDKYYISRSKTKVINMGDEIDAHTMSKWVSNPDGYSGGHEHEQALIDLHILYDIFPEQDFCISNHTYRPYMRAMAVGIPKAFLRDIQDALEAPKDCRWDQFWIYNDIKFEHGEGVSGHAAALAAAKKNRMSTVIGHQHSHGGVIYSAVDNDQPDKDVIFGMNTGCLIDVGIYAFNYGKIFRDKPTLGCGVILDNVPHFVPFKLDKNKRWIHKL